LTGALTIQSLPQERVHFNASVRDTLGNEVARLGSQRVFLATSRTLRRETAAISLLVGTLGNRCAAIFDSIGEHSELESVAAALAEARRVNADVLIGCGGGSIIDALKIVQLGLATGAGSVDDILAQGKLRPAITTGIRQIAVPTTLSGAETTPAGGGTDRTRGIKLGFASPMLVPVSVIYDPALGALSPEWLWLSSAMRGVDHCCEGILARNANAVADAGLLQALRMFSTTLRRTRHVPGDPQARSDSQIAAWLACSNSFRSGSGASHGIGYILGGRYGMHHGYGSCIMLPHVLRWNEPVTAERQKLISEAMGRPSLSAGDAVAELVSDLGLPSRLRDVGISRDSLGQIAEEAASHPVVRTNPRDITAAADVQQILDAAW
jgi:maleylacetate reductase